MTAENASRRSPEGIDDEASMRPRPMTAENLKSDPIKGEAKKLQ